MKTWQIFPVILLLILATGCANKQLETLKEIDQENRMGLVEAYDEALYRTKVERLDVENQIIDLQSDYDLVVMAYESVTGTQFDDVTSSSFISLNDLAAHNAMVKEQKEKRRVEILKSYDEFYAAISRAKDPKLMEAIAEIEAEREKTQSGFFGSIFDVIKKIIPV